jgi:O-antigen/teichoic acid export membrane protein
VIPWDPHGRSDRSLLRGSLVFGLPLVPHMISHWALQLADRLVIAGIVSAAALGRYGLASNIAMPIVMAVQALNSGFMPTYAKAGVDPGRRAELRRAVTLQIAIVVAICLSGALLGPPLVEAITPPGYRGAGSLVPWLVLGYAFLGLYFIPMTGAAIGAGRSRFVWVATATSAATNIGLLFWLVPDHGVHAAAVASAIGYAVLLVTIFIYAHSRPNPVSYNWAVIVPVIASALLVFGLAQLTAPSGSVPRLLVNTAWLAIFTAALALFGGITPRTVLDRLGGRRRA